MTFLEGRREPIERSYRRSIGITEEDEIARAREIISSRIFLQVAMRERVTHQRVVFGASLDEWMHIVNEDDGLSFSLDWIESHGGGKFRE